VLIPFCVAVTALLSYRGLSLAGDAPAEPDVRESFAGSVRAEKALNYEEAAKCLLPLRDHPVHRYVVNLRLGWLYYLGGKHENAKSCYQAAIKALSLSYEAKLGYLLPLLAQGNYEEAETVANQVVYADRNNYYGNLRLAFALRMQKKFEQAEKVSAQMLTYYPGDTTFQLELGLTKLGLGQKDAARRLLINVLLLDPDNATAKPLMSRL
jgi:tetratricopeptide (TPR) repeat protein